MNRTILIIIIIVLVIGAFWYVSNKSEDSMMYDTEMKDDAVMEEGEAMMVADQDAMMVKAGSYEPYSSEKLARAEEGEVVLFFKASWCPTCRALDTDIKTNLSQIPSDLTILEVDYDQAVELRKKYGVTVQHTLVQVDANGNLISKWMGTRTLSSLLSEIQS